MRPRVVVHYPEGWHTNGDAGVVPCSAFDPDPFQLRPGTEFPPELAIVLRVGQRSVRYVIDGGAGRSVIVTTSAVEGNDFSVSRRVLDAMVAAFDIDPRNEA